MAKTDLISWSNKGNFCQYLFTFYSNKFDPNYSEITTFKDKVERKKITRKIYVNDNYDCLPLWPAPDNLFHDNWPPGNSFHLLKNSRGRFERIALFLYCWFSLGFLMLHAGSVLGVSPDIKMIVVIGPIFP